MDGITILGYIAGTFSVIALVPQVIQSWKTKKTRDISLSMYAIVATGVFLWTVYGLLTDQPPIVFTNGIIFVLALSILLLKIRHG